MDSLQDYGSSSSDDEDNGGSKAQSSSKLAGGEKTQTNDNSIDDDNADDNNTPTDDSFQPQPVVQRADRRYLNAAPSVSLTTKAMVQQQQQRQTTSNSSNSGVKRKHNENRLVLLSNNPTKDVLYQPIQGPANNTSADSQRHLSRYEPKHMQANMAVDEAAFHEQRVEFQRSGRAQVLMTQQGQAAAPQELLRTTLGYERQRLQKFTQQDETRNKVETAMSSTSVGEDGSQKKKKMKKSDNNEDLVLGSDDEVEFGVWGPPSRQEAWLEQNKLTNAQTGDLAPEQMAEREYIAERNRVRGLEEEEERPAMTMDKVLERKMAHLLPPQQAADSQPMEATSTFHGAAEYDYQGRSWTAPPPGVSASHGDMDEDAIKCFVPKKCMARFGNPNKQGVHRIRLFPGTGHLLLSAGLDGVCQVWSVAQKKLMRSYKGHSAAVRDVQFNLSGTQFVSASFDRYLRLWDVESGEAKQTFSNGKVPYCVQFYPRDDTYFCVGCSDNRIVTYHTETGEITQEYNHHLAPVNAIVFVENKDTNEPVKMVTSSDDKKILVWEYDIGVPIKYISDPTMHSMPCMTMHPSGLHFVGQSLDNTINVIQTSPKIKLLHNKKYSGHIVSGYACDLAFSPDGRFLVSGDGTGALFIWDWKRHKILQKYRAHEPGKPTIGCVWHPLEPSTLFTCSWDGNIKMWQ